MTEMIATRRARGSRDRRAVDKLRELGRRYVEPVKYDRTQTVVAETGTLTPTVVGYLGFDTTPTSRLMLMPSLTVAEAAVDPSLSDTDSDAVFIRLLRKIYEGFDEVKRGYLIARIDEKDESTRRILEAENWMPTSHREGRSWIPYAWFARSYFSPGEPDESGD